MTITLYFNRSDILKLQNTGESLGRVSPSGSINITTTLYSGDYEFNAVQSTQFIRVTRKEKSYV